VRRLAPPPAPALLDALGAPVPMAGAAAPAPVAQPAASPRAATLRYNLTFRRAQ
jgi:hypothetical protein